MRADVYNITCHLTLRSFSLAAPLFVFLSLLFWHSHTSMCRVAHALCIDLQWKGVKQKLVDANK